ncbi:MAG TPA: SMP-30/gluconolactonase/LRE family protein [Polyangiaceae bacterium]|nr:SMP-30/gluconolactonase/LRE family protein [Polyangiaceae bacterium]
MASRRRSKRVWPWILLVLVCALAGYLLWWPSPIDPIPTPVAVVPEATGPLAVNEALRKAERLSTAVGDGGRGPETIAFDEDGRIYSGTHDGRIVRMKNDGSGLEVFTNTYGRPLGLAFDAKKNLIVADAKKGLLKVDPKGNVTNLATEAGGVRIGFADDLDIAQDGRIYFSDASTRFGYGDHVLDLLEGRPNGRLLRYDPATRKTEVLIPELYFANGVALAEDESFVLVNETGRLRITRLWLSEKKAGERDIFAEGLPGYPDGISRGTKGRFWVAIFAPVQEDAQWLAPRPFVKKVVARLPRRLWPAPKRFGYALALDQQGHIVETFQDPTGSQVFNITSAEEHKGFLYLGTLEAPHIGRLRLNKAPD